MEYNFLNQIKLLILSFFLIDENNKFYILQTFDDWLNISLFFSEVFQISFVFLAIFWIKYVQKQINEW